MVNKQPNTARTILAGDGHYEVYTGGRFVRCVYNWYVHTGDSVPMCVCVCVCVCVCFSVDVWNEIKTRSTQKGKNLKRDGWHRTHINSDELICEMYTHNNIIHGRGRPTCVQKKCDRTKRKEKKYNIKRETLRHIIIIILQCVGICHSTVCRRRLGGYCVYSRCCCCHCACIVLSRTVSSV